MNFNLQNQQMRLAESRQAGREAGRRVCARCGIINLVSSRERRKSSRPLITAKALLGGGLRFRTGYGPSNPGKGEAHRVSFIHQ
jgi:hypothetical protein